MENAKKSIKKQLDEIYGVTEEELDKIILEQKIEEEEKRISILRDLVGYKSFEDYLKDHEKEFDDVDITDDFKMIIISWEKYPKIDLDLIKKLGIIADNFGIFVYIESPEEEKIRRKNEV